jgi:hypothetical protein
MYPVLASEMVKARVDELRREAGARSRPAARGGAGRSAGWRSALGVRLVSLGSRLLGEPVRFDRTEVR